MHKLLPLLFLVGCWPYIDQPWADYDVPATTVIYGRGYSITPIGGYWTNGFPQWSLWFGWLEAPQANLGAFTPTATCTSDALAVDGPIPALAALSPAPTVTLNTASDAVSPAWDAPSRAYAISSSTTMYPRGTAFSLAPVDVNGVTQSAAPLFRIPPTIDVLTPAMTGATPPTVPRADIVFTWEVLDAKAPEIDHVQVTIAIVDTNGSSSGVAVCWAPYEAGTLTVTASALPNITAAAYANVLLGALTETATAIDGLDGASRVGMANYVQGAVYF